MDFRHSIADGTQLLRTQENTVGGVTVVLIKIIIPNPEINAISAEIIVIIIEDMIH
jgi:hypothetical protein